MVVHRHICMYTVLVFLIIDTVRMYVVHDKLNLCLMASQLYPLVHCVCSEYGERWHESGTMDKKQNVFDDFQAAAEYLIQNKYTTPER